MQKGDYAYWFETSSTSEVIMELQHDKTNKMTCAPGEDFAVRFMGS